MASKTSVFHEGFGCWWDLKRVVKAFNNCAAVWVEGKEGEVIRFPTVAEQQALRHEEAKRREPLAYAEVHGLRYDPAASGVAATRRERVLIFEAHQFVAEQAA